MVGVVTNGLPRSHHRSGFPPGVPALYRDDRFAQHLDSRTFRDIGPYLDAHYDLVVVPGPFEPEDLGGLTGIADRMLLTWDSGWELRAGCRVEARGTTDELNYFRSARPQPNGRAVLPTAPVFRPAEVEASQDALSRLFPGQAPVIVYNPTASNAFTRATWAPKEVDNALQAHEHGRILNRLLLLFPGHLFLVGSALKPGDETNAVMIETVVREAGSDRVAGIDDLRLPSARSLRGFASVLSLPRICSSVGSGTGTNTHLAALLGVPSLSIERGADA